MKYYEGAKKMCVEFDIPKVDTLLAEMAKKIEAEQNALKTALAKAKEMQTKMETAVFDKAVKEQISEWKGYNNYEYESDRKKLLSQIDSLDLSQNALPAIPKELAECPNLIHLNLLKNNDIDWKSLERLKDLPKLKSIYVSVNDLSDIDSTYWKKIIGVEILNDTLETIPMNILTQIQLRYLDINATLRKLSAEIGKLLNLEVLNLGSSGYGGGNYLTLLPAEIGELQNLKILYLSSNELKTLPSEIGKLQKLQILDLSYNKINSLPKEIGNLKQLETFYCGSNQLSSLPKEIGQLQNLTVLDLEENQLSSLPKEIGQLQNLTVLDLEENQLSSLPKEIAQLQNLTELDLYNNQLSNLPKEIAQLQNLTFLSLRSNLLSSLPKEITQLQNLTTLDLGFNQFSNLPKEIAQLQSLTYLNLYDNQFSSLPKEIAQLQNLTYLNLTRNQLSGLPTEIAQLQNLTYLSLLENPIKPEEQEKIKQLLPNCDIAFSEFTYELLLWAYQKQGILKEKIEEFKEFKKLDLSDYRIPESEQTEIQQLLPNCEISFRELRAYDYRIFARDFSQKGDYKKAYKYQQKACELDSTNYSIFFSLSFYACFVDKPEVAISAAQKTLALDSSRVSVETNLALGYLLHNQWEEAKKIYMKWKGKKFTDTKRDCNTVFLQDITDLEKAGVKHEDFEKVRELLSE